MADNETIADIIAEMETERPGLMNGPINTNNSYYARRLKAALERELSKNMSKSRADFGQLSNAAKLREALVSVKKSIDEMGAASLDGDPEIMLMSLTQVCARLSARIDAALAEPPRNCDVWTVGQQAKRFEEYCESEVCKRSRCRSRAKALCIERCALAWAQMPYEEGGDR